MRFCYDNKIDDYTLQGIGTNSSYPVTNVQDYRLSKYWRSDITDYMTYGDCENANSPTLDGGTSGLTNATWARSAAQAQEGSYSWLLTKTSAAAAGDAYTYLTDNTTTTDMHGLTAGQTYRLDCWMYTDVATLTNADVVFQEYYAAAWNDTLTFNISSASTWEREQATVTLNSATTGVTIKVLIESAEDVGKLLYLDDIKFTLENRIILDVGSGNTLNPTAAAILNEHNLSSNALIKIQGNATSDWTSPTVDETLTYNANIILKFISASGLRFWSFLFYDPDNTDEYIKIPRVYIGTCLQVTISCRMAFDNDLIDNSIVHKNPTGQVYGYDGVQLQRFSLSFAWWTNDMKNSFKILFADTSKIDPFIFVLDENDLTSVPPLYVSITDDFMTKNEFNYNWSAPLKLEEVR